METEPTSSIPTIYNSIHTLAGQGIQRRAATKGWPQGLNPDQPHTAVQHLVPCIKVLSHRTWAGTCKQINLGDNCSLIRNAQLVLLLPLSLVFDDFACGAPCIRRVVLVRQSYHRCKLGFKLWFLKHKQIS